MRAITPTLIAIGLAQGGISQNIGVGTTSPTHALHVVALSNPLRLQGLQSAADTDGTLTLGNDGVVRLRPAGAGASGWSITGNAGINASLNFIGTISAAALQFRTNNQPSGFIDPSGSKRNTAFGNGAMANASIDGSANTAVGFQALRNVGLGIGNVALGDSALFSLAAGSNNVGIGPFALKSTLGSFNIAVGANALEKNVSGSNNVAMGVGSLAVSLSASNNVALGAEALPLVQAGDNVAVGYRSGAALTTGAQNTAVGNFSMAANVSGANNTYVGYQAAQLQASGNGNTYVGFLAGGNFFGGSNNTMVGNGADALNPNATFSNSTALGAGAIIDRANMIRLGSSTITRLEAAVNLTVPSDGRVKRDVRENIPGLEFVAKLRPVSYYYDLNKWDALMGRNPSDRRNYAQKEAIRYSGFIAQEVHDAAKALGYDFSGVTSPQSDKGLYSIAYAEMVVPLVKAVQELNNLAKQQQREIDWLKHQLLKAQSRQ
jgi:trimeric autotransporter adhesin